MRFAFTLSCAFAAVLVPGSAAEQRPVAVAAPPSPTVLTIEGRTVHVPGFRERTLRKIEGNPFAPLRAREEDDLGNINEEIQAELKGYVIDEIKGNAVRVGSTLLRVGGEFVLDHTIPPRRGSLTSSPSKTNVKLTVREIHPTYAVFETQGGDRRAVPYRQFRNDGRSGYSDVVIGTGTIVHPSGLIIAAVPVERDINGRAKPLAVHTNYGRYELSCIVEDTAHGLSLFEIKAKQVRFPYAAIAAADLPEGSEVDAVFYDPGVHQERTVLPARSPTSPMVERNPDPNGRAGILAARARLPKTENGWIHLKGTCPVGVQLFNASGQLQGVTVRRRDNDLVWAVSASAFDAFKDKLGAEARTRPSGVHEVVVAVVKPLVFDTDASGQTTATMTGTP